MPVDRDRTERLAAALGGDALARVRQRIVTHLAAGGDPQGVLTLPAPTDAERQATAALLGIPPSRSARLRLPLAALGDRLRAAGLADDLQQALELLEGPIPDHPATRRARAEEWDAVVRAAATLDQRVAWLGGWATRAARTGRLKRASRSDPELAVSLLAQLGQVLGRLPVTGGIRRPRLANESLGAAHALDAGTPLATLVLEAVRGRVGPPLLDGAEGDRETWAAMGVLTDDLTSRACVLNLLASGDGQTDALLRASPGQPTWVTLRTLVTDPPAIAPGTLVHACENLSVIAEVADALGTGSAPLVCVAGNPVVAVMRLLDAVTAGGGTVAYHGDFDWPGVAIAGRVLRRLGPGGRPWRMGAEDYLTVLRRRPDGLPRLTERPEPTPWDPRLGSAMRTAGVAVEEEAVLATLIADLAAG